MKINKLLYSMHNTAIYAHEISNHFMPYSELTMVIKGCLDYYVDGVYTPISEGEAIYIRKGSFRSRSVSNELCDYISFNFEVEDEVNLPVRIKNAVKSEDILIISLFDKINGHYYSNNDEKIVYLLSCMLSLLEEKVKIGNLSPLTQNIISHINKNFTSKITLSSISEMTHFSTVYCDTVFKREVGQPIIDFIIDKRIEQSKKMLMNQSIPLQKISETVGFGDYNYFSRVFKKRTGFSPSTYRTIMLNM